jgi:glutamate racemase
VSSSESDTRASFFKKKQVTILITDSGLGGISICAEIARGLRQLQLFEKVSLIYFNAWPEQNRGYNRLGSTRERIQVFDRALEGMMQFKPDFILIACNTLSVLYPRTEFSQHVRIPVVDIVDFGVHMMHQALCHSPKDQTVILGTVTTIESQVHHDRLIQDGIQPGQIISQPCDQLATEIEKGAGSKTVSQMIQTYMQQAAKRIDPDAGHIYAALCCTHFGYCGEQIQSTLADCTHKTVTILNPNHQMAAHLLVKERALRFSDTAMDVQVVSKIFWEKEKIASISGLIRSISDETTEALIHYEHHPDLFA